MNFLSIVAISLLVGFVATKSIQPGDKPKPIKGNPLPNKLAIYTSEHDIYNLAIQINNTDENDEEAVDSKEKSSEDNDDDSSDEEDESSELINGIEKTIWQYDIEHKDIKLFFVEADTNESAEKDYKGLYVLQNGKNVSKLLENGKDTAIATDGSNAVYFAAADGLYKYNAEKNTAEKYGSLTDNFIDIAISNNSDVLYAINDKFEMYKITEEGTKKEKLDEVTNAHQLTLDSSNNIYYYDQDKVVYLINSEGRKKISDLPELPSFIQIVDPPNYGNDEVLLITNTTVYFIDADGDTSEYLNLGLNRPPSGYAIKSHVSRYIAYNKKLFDIVLIELYKAKKSVTDSFTRLARILDLD